MTQNHPAKAVHRDERQRVIWFLTVAMTVFLAGTWFVCATWNYFWGLPRLAGWGVVPYILSTLFVVSLLAGMRLANPWIKMAYRISAVWLGMLNFFLFAALGCWIVLGASKLFGLGLERHVDGASFYGAAVLASIYGVLNASWLRVTRVSVPLPNLPQAWVGREVVLMTDLHLGNVRGEKFMRRVVNKVKSLRPFAVFISGDMFDGPKADYDRLVGPCRDLSAPAGVYFVTGNHEEFSERAKYIAALQRAGVRVLNNEKVTVEGLQIVGVHDREAGEPEQFRKILQDAAVDRHQASILLAHQPNHLSIPEEEGLGLQVSGHTHKGQFWPWCWVIFKVHGPYAYGLNRARNLLVLTSSGAGTWGPPMRVGTKSEIVLIRLEAAGG